MNVERFKKIEAMVTVLAQGNGACLDRPPGVGAEQLVRFATAIVDELAKIDPSCKHTAVDSSGHGPPRCTACGVIVRYPR